MYSRIQKIKRKNLFVVIFSLAAILLATFSLFLMNRQTKQLTKSASFATKAKAEVIDKPHDKKSSSSSTSSSDTSKQEMSSEAEITEPSQVESVATETEVAQVQEPVVQQVSSDIVAPTATSYNASSVALANGNTAGEVGTSAAAQMAAATGVSQTVWEQIIARESNGNPYVSNGSGASGLFQTMPGWGSTATVQDQINSAINAYNAQGLSAWGY